MSTVAPERHYSSVEAMRFTGLSYRQLDHWMRVGVSPWEHDEVNGSGSQRRFTLDEMRVLRELAALRELGLGMRALHTVAKRLRLHLRRPGLTEHDKLFVGHDGEAPDDLYGPFIVLPLRDLLAPAPEEPS